MESNESLPNAAPKESTTQTKSTTLVKRKSSKYNDFVKEKMKELRAQGLPKGTNYFRMIGEMWKIK